ncbi:unnamed protein product [Peniophora sp. CBMAI 1063]|nr:unnamed protein product [Peniophora sp. CBMAI 1063]
MSSRNAADLPAELLAEIFEWHHTIAAPLSYRRALNLSQVCKTWRKVAISHGALWANKLDVSPSAELSRLVLERAGHHVLDIELRDISPHFARECLGEWFDPLRRLRTRSIDLESFGNSTSPMVAQLIGPSLPMLRSLSVSFETVGDYGSFGDEEEDEVDIHTLSIQHAPALTRVALRNCLMRWDADVYSQLTHLDIGVNIKGLRQFVDPISQCPTHAQMRSLISSLRHIVELKLDIFPLYTAPVEDAEKISVPLSCRRITLRSLPAHTSCCWFAKSLVVPPGAALTIIQVSEGDTARMVREFSRSSQALSVSTTELVGSESLGTVVIGVGEALPLWTQFEPLMDVMEATPGNHITLEFEFLVLNDDQELEEEDITPSCNNMISAISRLDVTELELLRIPGLRYADENESRFRRKHAAFFRVLADAEKVKVLILPFLSMPLLRVLAAPSATTHELLFPQLESVILSLYPLDADSVGLLAKWLKARDSEGLSRVTLHVQIKQKEYADTLALWKVIGEFSTINVYH